MTLRLELGCGMTPTLGHVHHDRIKHSPHVDVAWDLRHYPWPVGLHADRIVSGRWGAHGCLVVSDSDERATLTTQTSSFLDEILALDVFEHLSVEIQPWLDECWRLLVVDGLLDMRLPAWDHELSYRDPTHLRVFHPQTMHYWDRDSELYKRFGSIYFAESDKWWTVEKVYRENNDLRYRLKKRA